MSDERLEALVVEFLERREVEPSLTPGTFLAARAEREPGASAALRAALELESMFPGPGPPLRQIGPYSLVGEIGRGGMGIVYRAERDGRAFALKLLPLAPVLGPRMLERFRREAEALAQLSHPGIVSVHDSGMHDEIPYLVMDLVEGEPLQRLALAMSRDRAVALVASLAEILAAAHRRGILHRDLKPHNVMVRPDGSPVLLDFGLSAADEFPTLTTTGELIGTPRYMAPEHILGNAIDARTDVYALGLILFELVAKRPARAESGRDALLQAVRSGRIPSPRSVDPSIERDLEKIILVCLAADPARRYPSADDLAEDLRRFQRGEAVAARPPGPLTRAARAVRGLEVGAIVRAIAGPKVHAEGSSESTPAARREASERLSRALAVWFDGDREASRADVARVRALDPSEPVARVLEARLAGRDQSIEGSPCVHAAAEALRMHAAGSMADAAARLQGCASELPAVFMTAIGGLGAAERGDLRVALDELTAAARLLPSSVAIHRALASVCVRLDRLEDAAQAYRRAAELAPESAETWVALAEVYLRQRDLDEGLKAIATAESLAGSEDRRILRVRATLEVHSGRLADARAHLERLLEMDPDDVSARFEMAHACDSDHDIVGAERGYRRVLDIDPGHVRALIGLAHLHSGASRGQCRGCDAAFAANPEYVDLAKCEQYLLAALKADRGRSEAATYNIRDIALRLENRSRVVTLLERLTAEEDHTPAVLRLKDVLRRLHLTA